MSSGCVTAELSKDSMSRWCSAQSVFADLRTGFPSHLPSLATQSAGRARRSRRMAEFKRERKRTTNLAEGVAHKAHRLWDRVEYPACGLMDNASQTLLLGVGLNRPSPEAMLFSATKKIQGRALRPIGVNLKSSASEDHGGVPAEQPGSLVHYQRSPGEGQSAGRSACTSSAVQRQRLGIRSRPS